VDGLEDRSLLSGGITLAASIIRIDGTAADDRAVIRIGDNGTPDAADDRVIVRLSHNGHTHRQAYHLPRVTRIVFTGGNGNDRFQDFTPLPSVALGGKGNDVLIGGPEDTLIGGAGNNTVFYATPGSISVNGGRDKAQVIWDSAGRFREYRITCTTGQLTVEWHDESGDHTRTIEAGQSTDLPRADNVQVYGSGTGTYERLD
jgi:hypothetical protein